MTNDPPTPLTTTYCTAADVRAYSQNTDIIELGDYELSLRIVQAEVYIDSYAGYWQRGDGITQVRLFPRIEDVQSFGDGHIPDAVMLATIAQVEFMHLNMPDIDHGIESDAKPTEQSLSPRAKHLLKGYRRITGSITLPDTQSPATL